MRALAEGRSLIDRLLAPDGAAWRLLDGAAADAADLDGEGAGPWLARG